MQLSREAVAQLYRLYFGFLQQRLQALLADSGRVAAAAGVAQQALQLLLAAHNAAAADEGLYGQWVALAQQLKQHKVSRGDRVYCMAQGNCVLSARAHVCGHDAPGGDELFTGIVHLNNR